MSSAFNAEKGRGMSRSSSTVLPPTQTTNAPLRGFSLLTSTVTPGKAFARRFALVLNAPQLLQASTDTTAPLDLVLLALAFAAVVFLAGALALVFFAITANEQPNVASPDRCVCSYETRVHLACAQMMSTELEITSARAIETRFYMVLGLGFVRPGPTPCAGKGGAPVRDGLLGKTH